MKKQSLLLITGGILAFASCNSDTATTDNSQAKIDSMVNERVEEIRMELQLKNDSIINELAIYRADSIMAAAKGKKVTRTRPTPKPAPAPIVDTKETVDGGSNSGSNNSFKNSADGNRPSGKDKFKASSDANQESGKSKFKSKAD